jgi:hypothetical protein
MNSQSWLTHHLVVVAVLVAMPADGRWQAAEGSDEAALKTFTNRLGEYLKLHKQLESSLPPFKPTQEPVEIQDRQRALARALRKARSLETQNRIFFPEISSYIRQRIAGHFRSSMAPQVKETIRQGEPVRVRIRLKANDTYPPGLPVTTVPPTLLQLLPPLPNELEYRIVKRDLLLLDTKANLVVDLIRDAIPVIL